MPCANSLDTDQDLHGHVDVLLFFAYQVIFHSFKSSADFSPPEKFVFEKNQENLQRVKCFGSRSGPTFCWAQSGFKRLADVFSRWRQKQSAYVYRLCGRELSLRVYDLNLLL